VKSIDVQEPGCIAIPVVDVERVPLAPRRLEAFVSVNRIFLRDYEDPVGGGKANS
jgi:hypothetical protein